MDGKTLVNMRNVLKHKNLFILLGVIVVVYGVLAYPLINNDSIIVDELFTMRMLEKGISELLLIDDLSPPTYLIIEKILVGLLYKKVPSLGLIVSVKLVAFLPVFIATVFVVVWMYNRNGILGSIIVTVFYYFLVFLRYISYNRAYTWALLFVTCTLLAGIRIMNGDESPKVLFYFGVSFLLAAYVHYIAAAAVTFLLQTERDCNSCLSLTSRLQFLRETHTDCEMLITLSKLVFDAET